MSGEQSADADNPMAGGKRCGRCDWNSITLNIFQLLLEVSFIVRGLTSERS